MSEDRITGEKIAADFLPRIKKLRENLDINRTSLRYMHGVVDEVAVSRSEALLSHASYFLRSAERELCQV